MICLDTSFIIDLINAKTKALDILSKWQDEVICTTRINIFEVLVGIFLRKGKLSPAFPEKAKNFMENLSILELDEVSAIKAAKIKGDLLSQGREIETTDCLIAGIMLANHCMRIITRNNSHFERIPGLEVLSY